MIQHPVLGCLLSILLSVTLFCLFYVEYMINIPEFSLSSLSHVQLGIPNVATTKRTKSKTEVIGTEDPEDTVSDESIIVPQSLISSLKNAFEQEKVFLDQDLSIQKLAAHLSTNRTTLSAAVSQTYGVNFRQLVAHFRIEAAQKYMLENPEAKQELVAAECGFGTAQAFNQKFKEVVGESPRTWLQNCTRQ